jgi:hypothetical protein
MRKFDFTAKTNLDAWLQYAVETGATTTGFNGFGNQGAIGDKAVISWILPPEFKEFEITFGNGAPYGGGARTMLSLNGVVILSLYAGRAKWVNPVNMHTKRQSYTPGDFISLSVWGFGGIYGVVLTLYGEACASCPSGSYKAESGSQNCTHCPEGYIGANSTRDKKFADYINSTGFDPLVRTSRNYCQTCPPGTFTKIAGSDVCSPCPPGTYSVGVEQSSINECTKCRKGTYSAVEAAESSSTCTACESGKFHRSLGVTSADACKECLCRK